MKSAGRILIMPKGTYDSSITYEMLDLVKYKGTSWLAKKTAIGIEPSIENNEYWQDVFDSGSLEQIINELNSELQSTKTNLNNRINERLSFNLNENGVLQLSIDGVYYGTVAFKDK